MLSASNTQEYLGPSEDAEAEFAKELAKMVTDTSVESRKVDKKAALAFWDSAVLPAMRKRPEEPSDGSKTNTMSFTMLSRRGNKQQVSNLAIPTEPFAYGNVLDAAIGCSLSSATCCSHAVCSTSRPGRTATPQTSSA